MKIGKVLRFIIFFILIILAGCTLYKLDNSNYIFLISSVKSYFAQFGIITSATVFIVLCSLRSLLVIFPIFIFVILGGALFGIELGFIYSMIGATISTVITYSVGRYVAGDLVEKHFEKMFKLLRNSNITQFRLVLFLRLIMIMPFDIFGYVAGTSKIKFRDFILGTFLGILPEFYLYSYLGSVGATGIIEQKSILIGIILVMCILVVVKNKIYKRIKKNESAI